MKRLIVLKFLLLVLSAVVICQTPNSAVSRQATALIGIENAKLEVIYVGEGLERKLRRAGVESKAIARLESGGIGILRPPYPPRSSGLPIINIIVSYDESYDGRSFGYWFSVSVEEKAVLLRDPEIQGQVITWIQRTSGTWEIKNTQDLLDRILGYIDYLVDDWQTANRKAKRR